MGKDVLIGIDGGGSTTRVVCTDLEGRVLAHVVGAGTNPSHNATARENVQGAIREALAQAGAQGSEVRALVAGLAGFDRPGDREWAEEFTSIDGFAGKRLLLNDAQVAHAGALRQRPGIVAVLGYGSMIWAITEDGRNLRDYDFGSYSWAAARYLGLAAVHRILSGDAGVADEEFVADVLRHFEVDSVDALREFASLFAAGDHEQMKVQFGRLACRVTDEAMAGTPLAISVCQPFVENVTRTLALLGSCFASTPVLVATVGGVGRSDYFRRETRAALEHRYPGVFHVVEPDLSPLAGAILIAGEKAGADTSRIADNLRGHIAAHA